MSDPKDCLICVAGKSRGGVRAFALNQYPENQNSAIFLALIQTGNQKIQIDPRTGPTFGTIGSSARDQNRANELLGVEPRRAVRVRRAIDSSAGGQNLTNELLGVDPRQAVRVRRAVGSSAGDQNRANELLEAEPLACPPKRGLSAVPRITFRANADARRLKAARARLAVAAQQQRQVGGVVR